MGILSQLAIVIGLSFAGLAISSAVPVAIPGSIISLVLLFLLMVLKVVKPSHIKDAGLFLTGNMGFFFVAPLVAIMDYFDILGGSLPAFIAICVISTLATFLATAFTVNAMVSLQRKWSQKRQK
ncbi:MAG: CidA/LrgA family protein [Sphaerochaetaceae bacterium]